MKRISKLFIAILFIALSIVVVGCKTNPKEEVKDPTLALDKTTLTVEVGDEFTITPTIENLENGSVNYSFDNQGIVTYQNGKFTASQAGTVVITASLQGYENIKATVTVTVNEPAPTLVTSVVVSGASSMEEGETQTLVATVDPENATNNEVEWASSDSTVASVGTNGMVNALKAGTAIITATAKDGSGKSGSIEITVTSATVLVTNVSFSASEKMYTGKTQSVYAICSPNNATTKTVTWSSTNTDVLTVDSTGLITAVAVGTATIKATANDGSNVYAEKTIAVVEFVAPEVTVVNPEWEFEELGTTVTYNGKQYEFGYDAYAKLDDAIQAATKQTLVAPGEYPDDANINKSNFSLVGPNATVDPNKATRTNEAVITGTISIAEGSKNVTVKGLAFTTAGCVSCNVGCENITISYNNVYDTNDDVAAWVESRTQVEAVFSFWYSANTCGAMKNITIANNKFSNITESAILLARVTNVTVENNGFYNFKRDAIRGEGGYNWGDWVFNNNKFVNDELGTSNNGIYLQSVSGADDAGIWQTITITNSTFKNVGSSTSESNYNCAIAWRTYQEKGLTVDISYNTFENCYNYMNIRNNGATAATYQAEVKYNKFVGVPTTFYHKNLNGNDDTASNPLLTVMDYNLFLNADGTVIATVDATKMLDLKEGSNANNYTSKEAYNEMIKALGGGYDAVVSVAYASLEAGSEVEVEGVSYKLGESAFASIADAVEAVNEGATIYVAAGEYAAAFTVKKNNIKLVGPNAGVYAGNTNRNAEAVIAQVITVDANVSGFELNGFEITGAGQVQLSNGTTNTNVSYNVINGATADGTIHGPSAATDITSNLTATYNYSNNQRANRFVWMMNLDSCNLSYNELTSETKVVYDFINVQGYIKGKVDIIGNTYKNSNQSFIYAKGVGVIQATIEGNNVSGVANTIIDFRNMNEDGAATFVIRYNTFTESGCGWCPIRIRTAGYDANDSIAITVESNKFIDSFYPDDTTSVPQYVENPTFSSQSDPFKQIYVIGKNYYEIQGVAQTVTADNFGGAAISVAEAYATAAECPGYVVADEVAPTSVTISNKVTELEAFSQYQLLFAVGPENATNKKVGFTSSNTKAATVTSAGVVKVLSEGTTTITVYSMLNNEIKDSFEFTVKAVSRIEIRYEGNGVLKAGDQLQLEATYVGEGATSLTYTSSDATVATVDATGKVTAVKNGNVTITVANGTKEATVSLTVLNASELSDLLQLLVANNNGVVMDETFKYIGSDDGTADYEHEIYGSVNNYWAGTAPAITDMRSAMASKDTYGAGDLNNGGRKYMKSIEFIVIHDTGASGSTSTAKANAGWCTNPSNTGSSWQYTVGNDGIYQTLDDNIIAWHAGDGTDWAKSQDYSTAWYDTGVAYAGARPNVTLGADGYFYINGTKSLLMYPTKDGVTPHLNTLGMICVKGENGNYKMPTTHVGTGYTNAICARGGNLNGIGIESAVNLGSDVYLTWEYLAKLVAQLLVKYDLDTERVTFHNNFSNKKCPNTMITADLVSVFLKLVEAEYQVAKNYSDYKITYTSNNPEILDNTGRIVNVPDYTTNVSYTITVEKAGVKESVTLNSLVIGRYN